MGEGVREDGWVGERGWVRKEGREGERREGESEGGEGKNLMVMYALVSCTGINMVARWNKTTPHRLFPQLPPIQLFTLLRNKRLGCHLHIIKTCHSLFKTKEHFQSEINSSPVLST